MKEIRKLPAEPIEPLHYHLANIFTEQQTLAVNPDLGTVCLIEVKNGRPTMVNEVQLTENELLILLPLLAHFPYYAPYETLLASFTYSKTTDELIERCREHLQEAQEEGLWDQEMRPMRNVLSRARHKMRTFGIEISSILETGYILQEMPARKRAKLAS